MESVTFLRDKPVFAAVAKEFLTFVFLTLFL